MPHKVQAAQFIVGSFAMNTHRIPETSGKLDGYLRAKDCDGSYEREFRVRHGIQYISIDGDIARYWRIIRINLASVERKVCRRYFAILTTNYPNISASLFVLIENQLHGKMNVRMSTSENVRM